LEENIKTYSRDKGWIRVIKGKYEEEIHDLLAKCQNHNIFLYLDPYGIKPIDSLQFESYNKLNHTSFEMLINFNSFGFFREACRVKNIDCDLDTAFQDNECLDEYEILDNASDPYDVLNHIIGGDYWISIVDDYKQKNIDGYDAENRLSIKYADYLKRHFKYILNMPIRINSSHRPKYRMYHLCNHPDGCYLMAENMLKRKDELYLTIQQKGSPTQSKNFMQNFFQSTV
jgi:three-Cys-motif partner protein